MTGEARVKHNRENTDLVNFIHVVYDDTRAKSTKEIAVAMGIVTNRMYRRIARLRLYGQHAGLVKVVITDQILCAPKLVIKRYGAVKRIKVYCRAEWFKRLRKDVKSKGIEAVRSEGGWI